MNELYGLILCFSLLLFYFFTGRIVASHTLFGRNFASSSLYNTITAMGLWCFTALLANALNINLSHAWWFYVAIVALLFLYLLSSNHEKLPREHSLTSPLAILIFLAPTLYFTLADVPKNIIELNTFMRNAQFLAEHNTLANNISDGKFALEGVTSPQNGLLSIFPSFIFQNTFFEGSFAIFNVILLAFTADAMVKLTDLKTRWSNLALIAAGSIFSITILNPFFTIQSLTTAAPDLIFASAILAACIPLCRERNLPSGLGALPTALILSFIIGTHQMGVYVVILILTLWFIRTLFEEKEFINLFFSGTVLITLPALTWHLWAFYTQEIELSQILSHSKNGVNILYLVQGQFSPLALLIIALLIILLSVEFLSIRRFKDIQDLFTQRGWLTIPTTFTCIYIALASYKNIGEISTHIQFIAVVPFWYIVTSWYKKSKWQKLAYEAPWALALSLAIVFMSVQSIMSTSIKQRYNDPELHTLGVAKAMAKSTLKAGDNIAVLDTPQQDIRYSSLMRYGLTRHEGQVKSVNELLRTSSLDADIFLHKLKEYNFQYLWLHTPTENDKKWLGRFLKTDKSYLFKVEEDKLLLIKIYPHPSYDHNDL
tara:strand:- start:151280 stop:153079 length:1800 start_codon:yes stop_codon:yes gene_type:complete